MTRPLSHPTAAVPAGVSVAENTTVVTTVTSTDVDGGAPNYTIAGGSDAALFTIDMMASPARSTSWLRLTSRPASMPARTTSTTSPSRSTTALA
ncbi:MAG: hypothetical protein R3E48_16750 [Burkholderiaceae bacterium]